MLEPGPPLSNTELAKFGKGILDRIDQGRRWELERRDRIVCEYGVWISKNCWKCNGDENGNDRRTLQS
jgi:hypothetical protein